jgi:hypothetical protein
MAFTEQHKVFMVISYFRNGVKIDGVWQYSLALCMEEFGEEFPDIAVKYIYAVSTNIKHFLKEFSRKWTKTWKRQAKEKNSRSD